MNYTSPAVASGTGCTAGSFPITPGSPHLEDPPGNVSPEAISLVCAAASCPLTITIQPGASTGLVTYYDNSVPLASGLTLSASGTCESAS
jgi:hypothetical protein